ncbi:formate/nitrite transporter family protein [Profundibacterium mesophilum]|uniref:Transport n=1 Tax=Profundibacterium mesophilum KAUST100406-0324 TaxID=1037889 RepID=A0A921NYV8_9RHOB|nr:formate/nitrite transporter family protein [Profundibacterium mesophilum]KAF0676028.1 putative transport [Profundibacterium mesophilum KAUST100406-0324]
MQDEHPRGAAATEPEIEEKNDIDSTPEPEDEEAPKLSEEEEAKVREHRELSPVAIYSVIRAEGVEELDRPSSSLWWSGIAAGLGISTSVLAEGILSATFEGHLYVTAIENLGYTLGFVLVILARLQLFTENTITPILPILHRPSRAKFSALGRLWGIVFVANMAGTFVTAVITIYLDIIQTEHLEAMLEISRHFAEKTPWQSFIQGIPAGFFVAAVVWMLPSSEGFEILTIMLFTYLIAMGDFSHVVAGSTEVWMLVLNHELGLLAGVFGLLLPALAGNILGGTGLFALLAYGQVREELGEGDRRRETEQRKRRYISR